MRPPSLEGLPRDVQDAIAQDLVAGLRDARGVQAEAMLITAGALAGRAAALAVFEAQVASATAPIGAAFTLVSLQDGRDVWFSDAVNGLLFEGRNADDDGLTLWSLLQAAARASGAKLPDEMPARWAQHFARTLGGPEEGRALVPDGVYPGDLKPADAVRRFWLPTRERLSVAKVEGEARYGRMAVMTVGLVLGLAATVKPGVGAAIAMQAAMVAAKLPINADEPTLN